jgi:hypothetical protein
MHPQGRDQLRQSLSLALANSMSVTAFRAFGTGTSFEEAIRMEAVDPPIVPAGRLPSPIEPGTTIQPWCGWPAGWLRW